MVNFNTQSWTEQSVSEGFGGSWTWKWISQKFWRNSIQRFASRKEDDDFSNFSFSQINHPSPKKKKITNPTQKRHFEKDKAVQNDKNQPKTTKMTFWKTTKMSPKRQSWHFERQQSAQNDKNQPKTTNMTIGKRQSSPKWHLEKWQTSPKQQILAQNDRNQPKMTKTAQNDIKDIRNDKNQPKMTFGKMKNQP